MKRSLAILLALMLLLSGCGAPAAPTAPSAPIQPTATMTVHYIDVGQADSILLECD